MKIFTVILALGLFFSCKKKDDPALRLVRTMATDNSNNVFYTIYGYDDQGRMTSIAQYKNSESPQVTVAISYRNMDVILHSFPKTDPAYDQTTTVYLTLDAEGRTQKRIESSHGIAKSGAFTPTETFLYDTLLFIYDANSLLQKTTGSRYDSTWVDASYTTATHFIAVANYTNTTGNLTGYDEYVIYPTTIRKAGVTTMAGGSSEYHSVFSYNKSYPNRLDFTNEAILNEYRLYYEPVISRLYKNLPGQVVRTSIDKDINGVVIFSGSSTIDINRLYEDDGFLSAVQLPSQNTPYKEIKYFYGN